MKKICILSLGYMWFPVESGTSRFFQIANLFVKQGYQVEVITTGFQHFKKAPRDKKLILSQNYPFKITFIDVKPYKKNVDIRRVISNRGAAKSVKAYMNEHVNEYDAVYCAIPANNIAAVVTQICKSNNVPCVVDVEDLWPEAMRLYIKNPLMQKIAFHGFQRDAELTYMNASGIIGTSEDFTERAVKYNHRTDLPMDTVYVGCDLDDFDKGVDEYKSEIQKPEDEFWITYAGSISTSYDIKNVIDAVALANKNSTQYDEPTTMYQLQILGTGSEKESLESYVKEKNYNFVHFWGFTAYPKMAAVLNVSDLVINSFAKGASQSIVNKVGDYLASGKPMLNTLENPVFTSLIDINEVGTNIPAADAIGLADAIQRYWEQPVLMKEHGDNARKLAESRFDRKNSYLKIVEMVERVSN